MPSSRIPAIDGLRAVAILLVVVYHALYGITFSGGFIGVDIFFVLSGFLITSILFNEYQQSEAISLSRFYLRRFLRLMPALWFMLAFCVAIQPFLDEQLYHLKNIAAAGLYIMNWVRALTSNGGWIIGHTWSLGIEEQFYLLWPLILLAALRKGGRKAALYAAIACFSISTLMCFSLSLHGASIERIYNGFDTRSSELFVGCILALITLPKRTIEIATRLWMIPSAAMILIACKADWHDRWLTLGGYHLIAFLAAWMIIAALNGQPRYLKTRPAVYVGRISYSLYLWHAPILTLIGITQIGTGITLSIAIPLAFLLAALSYEFVERPFLAMSSRYFSKSVSLERP